MRIFTITLLILVIVSCQTEKKKETPNKTSKTELTKPSFLIGNWIRTNNKPDHITYEIWNSDFSGYGLTLKGKDTTFYEKMKLVVKNDTMVLEVSGVNEEPTPFKFTKQTDTSFVCKNLKNEFPQKIKYWIKNDTLSAKIWNEGGYQVDFQFVKK